jgi:hypothetical protein
MRFTFFSSSTTPLKELELQQHIVHSITILIESDKLAEIVSNFNQSETFHEFDLILSFASQISAKQSNREASGENVFKLIIIDLA